MQTRIIARVSGECCFKEQRQIPSDCSRSEWNGYYAIIRIHRRPRATFHYLRQRSRTFLTNGPWAKVFAAIIVTPGHIGVQFHRLPVSTRILTIPLPSRPFLVLPFKILDRLSSRPESFHRIEDKDPRTSDPESFRPLKSRPSSESTTKSLVRYRSKCSRHFLTSLRQRVRAGRHETLRLKSIRLNGKPRVRNFALNSSLRSML